MVGGVVLPGRSLKSPGDEVAASHDMSSERNRQVMVYMQVICVETGGQSEQE